MVLKNFYKALFGHMTNTALEAVSFSGKTLKMTTSNMFYAIAFGGASSTVPPKMNVLKPGFNSRDGGVFFGTGNTPPTLDDYCLSGEMITSFTGSASLSKGSDDSGEYITTLCTITNSGQNDFTIREVGLGTTPSSSSNYGADYWVLVERTVLDSPVTIQAGGIGQVTYTIRLNYPTA